MANRSLKGSQVSGVFSVEIGGGAPMAASGAAHNGHGDCRCVAGYRLFGQRLGHVAGLERC